MGTSRILLELTNTQAAHVIRQAGGDRSPRHPAAAIGLGERALALGPAALKTLAQRDDRNLSHSLVCGLLLLAQLPSDGTSVKVTDLACSLEMAASTVHRYVTTLLAVGLVEQDPRTRRYRLAPGARADAS